MLCSYLNIQYAVISKLEIKNLPFKVTIYNCKYVYPCDLLGTVVTKINLGYLKNKHCSRLGLVHTDCGNSNGKNGLYWDLWVVVVFAVGLHMDTSIRSNVTHSLYKKYLGFLRRCRSQCEQAFTRVKNSIYRRYSQIRDHLTSCASQIITLYPQARAVIFINRVHVLLKATEL